MGSLFGRLPPSPCPSPPCGGRGDQSCGARDPLPRPPQGGEGWGEGGGSRLTPAIAALTTLLLTTSATAAEPDYQEIFGEIELEGTAFAQTPAFAGQERHSASIAGKATLLLEWLDGDLAFRFTPFGRIDEADDERTHADVREFKLDYVTGPWSVTLGADTVFWGKTEAVHLVDVINQTDQVEGLDDEDRLGQPMLRASYQTDFGEFTGFYMPYFRERTFAGPDGRLRTNPAVDDDRALYDTDAKEWTPAGAVRYTGVFGDFDIGLSGFYGLGRDPSFVFDPATGRLLPFYELIGQVGFDGQYTSGATLWKAEAIGRFGQKNRDFEEEDFFAATGGLEHTLFGVADSNADLGLIFEYAIDSRLDDASTPFQNDAILGLRLALNDEADTTLLMTGAVDAEDAETVLRLEASRRIGEDFSVSLEGQGFLNVDPSSQLQSLERDSVLRVKLTYFFGL